MNKKFNILLFLILILLMMPIFAFTETVPLDFSITFWVNDNSNNYTSKALITKNEEIRIVTNSESKAVCSIYNGENWNASVISSSALISDNWNNISCIYDKGFLKLFINGILDNSIFYGSPVNITENNFYIGHDESSTYSNFVGSIDEVKIFNKALYEDQVKEEYLNSSHNNVSLEKVDNTFSEILELGFTEVGRESKKLIGDTEKYSLTDDEIENCENISLISWWPMESYIDRTLLSDYTADILSENDFIFNSSNITFYEKSEYTRADDFYAGDGYAYLDGESSYFSMTDRFPYNLSNFTVSGLFRIVDDSSLNTIFHLYNSSTSDLNLAYSRNNLVLSAGDFLSENYTINLSTNWNHFAVTYSEDNYIKLYINGRLIDTYSSSPNINLDNAISIFGASVSGFSRENYFKGGLDNMKLFSTNLSDNQISQEYNAIFDPYYEVSLNSKKEVIKLDRDYLLMDDFENSRVSDLPKNWDSFNDNYAGSEVVLENSSFSKVFKILDDSSTTPFGYIENFKGSVNFTLDFDVKLENFEAGGKQVYLYDEELNYVFMFFISPSGFININSQDFYSDFEFGVWNNFKVSINVLEQSAKIHVNNKLIYDGADFNSFAPVSNILFYSSITSTEDFYIDNIKIYEPYSYKDYGIYVSDIINNRQRNNEILNFSAEEYKPFGTEIHYQFRCGNSKNELLNSSYSEFLINGSALGDCSSKTFIQYKATLKTNNKVISPELYSLALVFNDEFDYLSSSEIKNKDSFILGKESNILSFSSTDYGDNLLENSYSQEIFNWRAVLDSSDTSSYISNISLDYSIPQVAELVLKNNYPVFFQFDMSNLPRNAKILDAKLRFYIASKNTSGKINLSLLTSDWGIGNSIQPTYSSTSFTDQMVNLTGWQEFDITDVTSLVNGYNRKIWDHFSNYGNFGIRLST
ncbi:hypothetical protein K9M42_03270, partial [Patescibacteria group bacterium]|nr:hypothetical protein [Patescibacteria group bacterium]